MRTLYAQDVLSSRVLVADPECKPIQITQQVLTKNATHVAVVEDNYFHGLVDLVFCFGTSNARIFADLVPREPSVVLSPDASLEETVLHMRESVVSALPVVCENGEYVGAVTHESVFAGLAQETEIRLTRDVGSAERQFRDLLECAPDAMILVGADGVIRLANSQTEALFGYRRDELVGQVVESLVPVRFRDEHPQRRAAFFASGSKRPMGADIELVGRRKDGSEVPVEVSLNPIEQGEETVVVSVIRDVTKQRLRLDALRRSKRDLAIRNRIADIFLQCSGDEVYAKVLDVVLEATGSKYGFIGVIDERGDLRCPSLTRDIWVGPEACPVDVHDSAGVTFPRDAWAGLWKEILLERTPKVKNARHSIPDGHVTLDRSAGVPLVDQDKLLGIIHVANKSSDYGEPDKALLQTISDQIGPILSARIENKRLENVREQAEQALVRQMIEAKLVRETCEVAAEAKTFNGALEKVLKLVCRTVGWPVGHAYVPSDDGQEELKPTGVWYLEDPKKHAAFKGVTERTRFSVGVGLPGRILESGNPAWIKDVQQDDNFARAKACEAIDVRGAFGFPIKLGDRVIFVLEFFAVDEMQIDDGLLAMMRTVGEQLGRVFERRENERRLRRQKAGLERAVCERTASLTAANKRLTDAIRQANAATQAKSAFLANMSHELRTPLNGVIGMTELLLGTELNATQRRYASLARASGDALLTLINDVLDLSKIEAGKLELERVEFDLRAAVENVAVLLAPSARDTTVELLCKILPSVPTVVRGDPGRLQQILRNLVGNALKFTEQGQVVIRVMTDERVDSTVTVRFSVTDTGVGIAADRTDRIFESFSQADGSTTRKYGGTGLGLAISKHLVEMMGGDIGVESSPGQGSTFWFTAKFEACAGSGRPTRVLCDDLRRVRVLAVDNNATNREILQKQLSGFGLAHATAPDGATALRVLHEAAASGNPFGLAIIDMQMPGMDGEQLARAIRADPLVQDIPLFLLTSVGRCDDAERIKTAGFNYWLTKPVIQAKLLDGIVETLACASAVPTDEGLDRVSGARPHKVTARTAGARILLAEDNEIGREVAETILTNAGYQCDVAANGREAVEAVLHTGYDVVLMDCQMPEMDGFEATRLIREHEKKGAFQGKTAQRIPIVALTANALRGDRERCFEAGMDDHISKPLDPQRLVDTIEAHLGGPNTEMPSVAQPVADAPGMPAVSAEPSPGVGSPKDEAPFDVDTLLERWGENLDLIERLFTQFQARAESDLNQIERGVAAGDAEKTASAAHALKGAAAYLEAGRVRELTARLEEMGRAADLGEAEACLAQLRSEIRRCLECVPNLSAAGHVSRQNND